MNRVVLLTAFVVALHCLSLTQHAAWSNNLILKFDYAAKDGVALSKNSFVVSWNGVQLAEIFAKDHYTSAVKFNVTGKVGENVLNFAGKNVQIDNVELVRKGECGKDDVLVNGDFSDGFTSANGAPYNAGSSIQGWRTHTGSIELGYGRNYNKRWQINNPVVKFASDAESDIYQTVVFNEHYEQVSDEQPN